ncbi:MAG: hypothetical protein R3E31_13725 [Chloroflexota bacterium]
MAFVLWLFYSLSAYYVVQKPFTMPMLTEIMAAQGDWLRFTLSGTAVFRTTLDILTALWLAVVALGTGLWLLTWLHLPQPSPLERSTLRLWVRVWHVRAADPGLGVAGLAGNGRFSTPSPSCSPLLPCPKPYPMCAVGADTAQHPAS